MRKTDPTKHTTQKTKKMSNTVPPNTQHRIIKNEQHAPHKIPRVNSGAPEGKQYKAVSTKLHWRKSN